MTICQLINRLSLAGIFFCYFSERLYILLLLFTSHHSPGTHEIYLYAFFADIKVINYNAKTFHYRKFAVNFPDRFVELKHSKLL